MKESTRTDSTQIEAMNHNGNVWKYGALVVIALGLFLTLFGHALLLRILDGFRSPDRSAMLRHIADKLSEKEMRSIFAQAKGSYKEVEDSVNKQNEELRIDKAQTTRKCLDVVYRTKNPSDCHRLMVMYESDVNTSVDQIFEELVLGRCQYALNVRDAKKWDCLPK